MDQTRDTTTQPAPTDETPRRRWAVPAGRRLVVLSLALAVVTAGSLWVTLQTASSAEKAGDGVRRTDITSLTERMPALAIGRTAVWYSGWMNGQKAADEPVPTWMDAVVTLPEGRAADLASAYSTAPVTRSPEVVDDLTGDVPTGELQSSVALDNALSTPYWHASAYLSVETDEIVLVVEGRHSAR